MNMVKTLLHNAPLLATWWSQLEQLKIIRK